METVYSTHSAKPQTRSEPYHQAQEVVLREGQLPSRALVLAEDQEVYLQEVADHLGHIHQHHLDHLHGVQNHRVHEVQNVDPSLPQCHPRSFPIPHAPVFLKCWLDGYVQQQPWCSFHGKPHRQHYNATRIRLGCQNHSWTMPLSKK